MQRNEQAFKLKSARAYVAIGGQTVELNIPALLGKVAPVSLERLVHLLFVVDRSRGHRIEAGQLVQRAAHFAITSDNLIGNGASERCAVRMDQREVRAP